MGPNTTGFPDLTVTQVAYIQNICKPGSNLIRLCGSHISRTPPAGFTYSGYVRLRGKTHASGSWILGGQNGAVLFARHMYLYLRCWVTLYISP